MSAPLAMSRFLAGCKIVPYSNACVFILKPCCRNLSSGAPSENAQTATVSDPNIGNASRRKAERISQAMRAYLERAQQFDDFMKAEVAEYEIGKRHLANIMGVDAETFTQKDIDLAIAYLLPSGLTDKKAHPIMKHPVEVIPQVKAAQFGMDGRPFQHMFYTCKPNYYQLLHETAVKYDNLKAIEDREYHVPSNLNKRLILAGSQWVIKNVVETKLKEKLQDAQFEHLTRCLERLASHPYSMREKEFIMQFRKELQTQVILDEVPPLHEDESGRKFMDGEGSRKNATAKVRIYDSGTGEVVINGMPMLDYFHQITSREQIMTPLQLAGKLNKVDVFATVTDGGPSGQAGAVRLAVTRALQSFVGPEIVEQMRLAGLLTRDPRVRERKKPGQEGARRKFTWKKR